MSSLPVIIASFRIDFKRTGYILLQDFGAGSTKGSLDLRRPRRGTMKRFTLAVAALLFLFACGSDQSSGGQGEESETYLIGIAISMKEDTPFFVSLVNGAGESADLLDVEIITLYADENAALQSSQIIELANRGIDALLLNPVNDSVIPATEEFCRMGIPVLTIDRGISSGCILCHISSDNRSGGRMAGEYLAEALHRSGNVVEIMGTDGSSAAIERGIGFREALSAYPDIEIIDAFNADFSRDLAEEGFLQLLQQTSDIDGVFAHNDDMILGAIDAAGSTGSGNILFIGFDAIDEAISAVENGYLMATIAQRPAEMGQLGVETAVDILNGLEVPDSIIVDLALILR